MLGDLGLPEPQGTCQGSLPWPPGHRVPISGRKQARGPLGAQLRYKLYKLYLQDTHPCKSAAEAACRRRAAHLAAKVAGPRLALRQCSHNCNAGMPCGILPLRSTLGLDWQPAHQLLLCRPKAITQVIVPNLQGS